MKRFSERMGLTPTPTILQVDSMSEELKNSLWNVLYRLIWSSRSFTTTNGLSGNPYPPSYFFARALWENYYKRRIDECPAENVKKLVDGIKQYFFLDCRWYQVYEFIEFVLLHFRRRTDLTAEFNKVLDRELAGFRIIEGLFVQITDEQEIEMLNEALQETQFKGVSGHLKRALELMSDRQNPDYRNSIKESISAVEGMAQIIAETPNATLTDAIKSLEKKGKLHGALKKGWEALYNYTSDGDGIRHAMLDEPDLTVADAKYFLLSCTSFVNYLKSQI